ncbi:breast cancer type 2 susceptibility protein-like [Leptopilina heterotoma]|uniref:breast cancer type 2 susceptibility protein-like n=1 Tax=Leptopilina heterotoma TaxID=63436 RepID=UPI001CA96354|nr:breast cancer type 2 susceptibility protein-like [Leptopilina heterotoma]
MSENNSNDVENNDGESEKKNYCNNMFITNNINEDYPINNSQQDLFSEWEETNQVNERTLQRIPEDCSFLNSFKTPVILSDVEENVSNSPVIPKTPASLAPFIYKINEPWTSDLETPEAKLATKLHNSSIDKASKQHQTPILERIRLENDASPILSNNKKRKPKRQIFKANAFENFEITPSFENILKTEESKINSEIVKEAELITTTVQEEVSNNSTNLKNSSPKCSDSETKVESNATSSVTKSLIDKYKEVKNFLEGQENFEIPKIDIPESDMLKSVIQLERASADFSHLTKPTTPIINETELVPFSQFFKNTNESFTEIKDKPKMNEVIKEKVLKENHCQEENRNTTKSPHSKQVKIFKDNKSEEKIPVMEEESEIFDLSQWLYTGKSLNESTKLNGENEDPKNFEKETVTKNESDQKTEKFDEKMELEELMFQEMDSFDFVQNFGDKITPEDLKKDLNLEETKFTGACGFSTAGGRSIKINEDKLKLAKRMYQETENDENCESKLKTDKFSKTNSSNLKKEENFKTPNLSVGFSTAGGKSIKIDKDKLARAEKMYQETENNENCELKLKTDKFSKTTDKTNSSNLKMEENFETPNISVGFSTAGGRSIKIDKDKLAKAEKMYQETENNENHESKLKTDKFSKTTDKTNSNLKTEENFQISNMSVGFSTAGGKSIKIDKDKLARAEKMYQETENNESCESKLETDKFSKTTDKTNCSNLKMEENFETPNISVGFSTAGGRSINIDKDKLAKAEKIYQEIENKVKETFKEEEIPSFEIASTSKENHLPDLKTNYTSGFATAGGKNIAISHEKLSRAQKIYNEIEISATDKEVIGKENEFFPNESNKTPKTNFSSSSSQNKTLENSSDLRRKVIDRNTNNSKQFKPLQIGIPRNSPLCNRNLTKSASKAENAELKSNDFKTSIQEELFDDKLFDNIDEFEIEDTRKNCSLPVNSENKIDHQIKQRLSLSTPVRSKKFPPLNQHIASLSEHLIPESPQFQGFSSQKISSTMNSSPFCGFTLSESLYSTIFYSKFVNLLEKVNKLEKTISPICETASKRGEEIDIESKKNSQIESKLSVSDKRMEMDLLGEIQTKIASRMVDDKIGVNSNQECRQILSKTSNNLLKRANLNLQNLNNKTEDKDSNRRLQWNVLKRPIDEVDDNTPLGRYDNLKKQKLNYDLMGKKLFTEGSISDDETETTINSLNQPGTSSSNSNRTKESQDYNSSILTDTIVSEEFFKPFTNVEKEMEQEKNNVPEEMPKSPVLGKSKFKKRRKLRTTQMGSSKMEKFDSVLSDCSSNLQTYESLINDSEVLEKRISAAFELDKIISRKRKEKPRPTRGSFLANREENKNSRISLYKLANGSAPTLRNEQELKEREINPDVLNVTASTAEFYKFKMDIIDESDRRNLVSLKVGDGATLVLDKNCSAGVEEFERAFEASPGVDPNLLPRGWLRNHYRWIVWKLASLDRIKLGSSDTTKLLTPDRVMKDLKYRYDREIDRSQRPVIRKILEKDEVPSQRMVLCIAMITESVENEIEEKDPRILLRTPRWKIEVTDGWYSIPVSFDTAMMKNIVDGKIQEGTKIVTYGAELLNCDQGCYPLEKLENVCLKIHTNSTRRARWDVKLGLQKVSGPINSSLKAVDPNGGFIGQVNVIISRIYPIMYREKTSDGQSIYRNEKQEEKAAINYNNEREKKAELLFAKAQEKLEGNKHDSSEEDNSGSLTHFDSFNNLTEAQRNKLFINRQAKMERLKMEINEEVKSSYPPRNVVPVRKIRINDGENCAILTIWSSNDDVSIFKEGNCYSIYNINAYGRRDGELHLTASRQAIFKSVSNSSQIYPRRQFTPLPEISVPGFEPPYRELDTIGVVSWIGNTPHGMKNFDAICISCPNDDSSSTYLLIMFWQGISSYGFSNILTVGSLIACSNLEIRKTRSASNISLCYCSERTVFTKSPRQPHLLSAFEALNKQITDLKSYAKTCGEEISTLLQKKPISRISGQGIMDSVERNSANNSPHFMVAKTPMDVDTPIKSSAIKKRFARLTRYAEPPELSPMVLNNSRNVNSSFRPVIMTPTSTKLTNIRPDTT